MATHAAQSPAPAAPPPGGQDAIVLQRHPIMSGTAPEFISATLLPGLGMDVLQITAHLPDHGDVNLLASPTLAEASQLTNGKEGADLRAAALQLGGRIEAPWAGPIYGTQMATGQSILALWNGRGLSLPALNDVTEGGLLLTKRSDSIKQNVMPDGGEVQTVFTTGNFDGHWPSHTEVTTTVQLSSRSFSIRVIARNTGTEPTPMGLGWRPRFAVVGGDRADLQLHMPSSMRIERGHSNGMPTGNLLPVKGTPYDFSDRSGTRLGDLSLNDTFVHLRPEMLNDNPEVELIDPAANYRLRMTTLTKSIRALHVEAPAQPDTDGKAFISISPQTNYDDALGREWRGDEDTGLVVLQPGESIQWSVRLELFPLGSHGFATP
jgi:galactose mutarotase-like enzyme